MFSKNEGDIGRVEGVEHKIDITDSSPIKQNPSQLPLGKRQEAVKNPLVHDVILSCWYERKMRNAFQR